MFHTFAELATSVGAVSGRLDKMALIGAFLHGLDDDDLAIAARFLAGTPFALHDERVLSIGGASVRAAIHMLTGIDAEEWQRLTVELGDSGDAAGIALAGHAVTPGLRLEDVQQAFDELAAASGSKRKTALLAALLERATPLEATFLIKLIGGELRIGVREAQVEEALARAFERPARAVRHANMLLGDIGATALLTRHNTLNTARLRLFHPLKFMLASPIAEPQELRRSIDGDFFVEDKYDGIRAQAHRTAGHVVLYSRTLDVITLRFPEITTAMATLPDDVILDGEILAAHTGTIMPFAVLQTRLGRKTVSAELLAATPVIFVIYDLLYFNGRNLLDTPLAERRALLEALPLSPPLERSLLVRASDPGAIDALFTAARDRGNEGLMVKDPAAHYRPGKRGREWLKVKRALATLDVVVTAAEVGHGKRREVLSDYTFAVRRAEDDATLLNIGKAYSGLTDAEIAELTAWFRAHTMQRFGRVHLVEPQIVLEVAFDAVQPSPRHKSGYALRFPRIVRLRPDKLVSEIDTLESVAALVHP